MSEDAGGVRHRNVASKPTEAEDEDTLNESSPVSSHIINKNKDRHYYGSSHACGVVILLSSLIYILNSYTTFLPPSKSLDASPTEFSGDRARKYLEGITRLGPRPSGSYANDIEAVGYILQELQTIQNNALEDYVIEVEVQTESGSFAFFRESNYIKLGFTSTYENISNVVARISPRRGGSGAYVLANAHYDTVMNTEVSGLLVFCKCPLTVTVIKNIRI